MATDAPPPWLLALIPVAFLVGFPLMWMAVMFLLSQIGGWSTLARRYRATQPFAGNTQRGCSANVGMVGYNKTLIVGANELGLHLAVPKIFAFKHPALFIPWTEIRARRGKVLFIPTVNFEIGQQPMVTLRMHRRFADPLEVSARGQLTIAPESR